MKNGTNQKAGVVETITLHIRIGDSIVRVVFGAVRNVAAPVLLGTSFIDTYFKGSFPPERKIKLYNPKQVRIIAIKHLPEKHKNREHMAKGMMTSKEKLTLSLVHVAGQTKIPPRSEGMVFVATEAKELVQIGQLLELDST